MKAVNAAVSVLKLNPHLRAPQLHQLLSNCISDDQSIDAQYMANVRKRYEFLNTKSPYTTEVTQVEGNMIIDRCRIKQSEIDLLDTLKERCNIKNMYKNLLQNGSIIWKALAYLRSINETMSGFGYRVHYDNESPLCNPCLSYVRDFILL